MEQGIWSSGWSSVGSPAAVDLVHHAQLQMILQVLPHTIACALHAHTRSLQHARWSYTADLLLKSHEMNPRSQALLQTEPPQTGHRPAAAAAMRLRQSTG